MAVVASWDGTNRLIYLAQGVTEFHPIEDIYEEYREERRTNEAFRVWSPFMEAFGNVPKSELKATPRYLVLLDGVKIVPYDEPADIHVTGEIITNDYTAEAETFYLDDLTSSVHILQEPADAEIVYIEIPSPIADALDYGYEIHIDTESIYSGQEHPVGTAARPVNNLADASAIAELYGISSLCIHCDSLTLDRDFDNWTFSSRSAPPLINLNGYSTNRAFFDKVSVTGQMSGRSFFSTCGLKDVTNFCGNATQCSFDGTIQLCADQTHTLSHCVSVVAGNDSPHIDMNEGNYTELSIRAYSGGIAIHNCDTTDSLATIEMIAGKIHIKGDCTSGLISVRGTAWLHDLSNGTTVDKSALINSMEVTDTMLDEQVSEHNSPGSLGSYIRKIFWGSR